MGTTLECLKGDGVRNFAHASSSNFITGTKASRNADGVHTILPGSPVSVRNCKRTSNAALRAFANDSNTPSRLRPVKLCPGVPGIQLNAAYTVSMAAALLCGAGASPVHKVSRLLHGSQSDRGPRACAKTCLGEVATVKKRRPRTSCTACSSKRTAGCQRLVRRSCKVCLFPSSWARITSPMYWEHV